MAITQINDYSIGDINLNSMVTTLDNSYAGKADISISAYSTTAAPDVKVGSVFDIAGAMFEVDTSDITPTGYPGITVSTTFYLIYDESAGAFVYSEVAPTWSDAYQGWYSGLDRYFFSMYKDSGGTLYQNKSDMPSSSTTRRHRIPLGSWDMDAVSTLNVTHGITEYQKISNVSAMIINDAGTAIIDLGYTVLPNPLTNQYTQGFSISSTQISILIGSDGFFNSVGFDDTTINRGWLYFFT